MRIISTLLLLSVLAGCEKNEDHLKPPIEPPISPGNSFKEDSFYFKGKLNGTDVHWIVPAHKNEASFTYYSGASLGYTDFSNDCLNGYCWYLTASTQIQKNVADVRPQMNALFNMAEPTYDRDVVLNWFTPGLKTYQTSRRNHVRPDLLNPAMNGAVVHYIDQNGKTWSSNWGKQPGSHFESVSLKDEKRRDVAHEKVWKAKFSCWLYDYAGTDSIRLDNGEIYGPILLPKAGR